MVAAYHLIWTAYGWWLPNDPRGSMSEGVAIERIAELGPHHCGRKVVQPSSAALRDFYDRADGVLKHELLRFDIDQVQLIGRAFDSIVDARKYTCYACAIMPDHVHLLIRKHREKAEEMITNLQEASRSALVEAGHRSDDHPVWGGPGWKVFQHSPKQIETTIRYIRDNPIKIGRPVQNWPFVIEYDGWMPGRPPHLR